MASKKKSIVSLSSQVSDCENAARALFSCFHFICLSFAINSNIKKFRDETIATHEKKLNELGIRNTISPCNPNKVVFTYSSFGLSNRLKILLAYGLDFHLPVYEIDFYNYFLAYESLIARMKSLGLDKTIYI